MDTAVELPGSLLVLVRLSADMADCRVTAHDAREPHEDLPANVASRQLTDELLEYLVGLASAGSAVGPFDVAVLGYRTDENGTAQLFSLLPLGDATPRFVPLAQVANLQVEGRGEGQPRKWAAFPKCVGDPCAADALARVYLMVAVWLTGRFAARPPVVIHCTTADGLDESYFRVARSLGLLSTGYGPVRLFHQVFAPGIDPLPAASRSNAPPGEPWAALFALSGELPESSDTQRPARRALAVNCWDLSDHWDAVFTSTWRNDTVEWRGSGGFSHSREMWAQKMGNSPDQWEDAYAVDPSGGVAAVSDGASTGIYCNIWAQQLSQRFLIDRPDTREPVALNKWVNGLRSEWRTAIKYSSLNWSKQAKVDQTGAAATLLAVEIGPAGPAGTRPWRACAVGDASLFWVRDGRLLATFPVVAADQFGSAPLLVRSNPGFKTLALIAQGTCRPGDRFVLATDAVAARLFKSSAVGPGPNWGRFEKISQDAWRAELDTLRQANDMVNDDCTLVVLRVTGGEDGPGEVEELAEPVEETLAEAEEVAETEPAKPEPPPAAPEPEEDEPRAAVHDQDGANLLEEDEDAAHRAGEQSGGALPHAPDPESVISAAVGDLMIDFAHGPRAGEAAPPEPRDEPPPAEEPPAARDGFPESTDTRD